VSKVTDSFLASNLTPEQRREHCGRRKGARAKARKGGIIKICVFISKSAWQAALATWTGTKASRFVNDLVWDYVKKHGCQSKQEAAI
jgi:hypothetical protein